MMNNFGRISSHEKYHNETQPQGQIMKIALRSFFVLNENDEKNIEQNHKYTLIRSKFKIRNETV